jgi:hypothetical protein
LRRAHSACPPVSQSYVFVYVQLPPGVEPRQARVDLTPHSLAVHIGDERVLSGPLFAPVKAEESVWLISARPPAGRRFVALLSK